MGFDVERFATDVNDGLLCCICRDVLEDPLQSESCEHAFCGACIRAWLVHEAICPEDRQPLLECELRPLFRYMRNDLAQLMLRCTNQPTGCEYVGRIDTMARHEATCEHGRVTCGNVGCGVEVVRRDAAQHARECTHRAVAVMAGSHVGGPGVVTIGGADGISDKMAVATAAQMRRDFTAQLELLRAEMQMRLDEDRRVMNAQLEEHRRSLVQREARLQRQVDELRSQNARLLQEIRKLYESEKISRRRLDLLDRQFSDCTPNAGSSHSSGSHSGFVKKLNMM